MYDIVFADCEGNDLLPGLTRMWTIQLATDPDEPVEVYADQPGYSPISEALDILRNARKVVFHWGIGFDFWAINKLYPGTLREEQIIDTVILSRLMDPESKRHSLEDLGEALGYAKGDFSDFSQFSQEMVDYGRRDVEILQKAWKGTRKVYPFGKFYEKYQRAAELEFKVAFIIARQEHHGFRFDQTKAAELEVELRQEKKDIERELREVFPPIVHERYSEKTGKRLKDVVEVFNPGSRDQIASRLIDRYGWKPKATTDTGKPKVDETILSKLEYPEAALIARYMRLGKMLGQLSDGDNAWMKLVDDKGYIHGRVNTIGCRTHRMTHFKPNMAQVDKDSRMRSLFTADPGDVLVGADAEGLELRMLAHYLALYDGGAYIETVHKGDKKLGTDIHTVNQKIVGLQSRDSAKTIIYALIYGAGDAKLGETFVEDLRKAGMPVPNKSLTKIGKEVRERLETGIVGLKDLVANCKKMHNIKKALPGLDGRFIPSSSEHSALNTLLQGNGAIVMKQFLVHFDEALKLLGMSSLVKYCANVHDEIQVSSDPDAADAVIQIAKDCMVKAGETLGVRCPLVGDAVVGQTWADTH